MIRILAVSFATLLLVASMLFIFDAQAIGWEVEERSLNTPSSTPSAVGYRDALDGLYDYFLESVGPPPNARSVDWGVYHEYHAVSHGAMVTGATTSESMSLAFVFGTLYQDLGGDIALMTGTLDYVRRYMMPHDGISTTVLPDDKHNGFYQPCLLHWLADVEGGTYMICTGIVVGPNTAYLSYDDCGHPGDPDPDRECYISPDDYRYASAPDADQWLAAGLWLAAESTGHQAYEDVARCIISSLHDSLTTAEDFRNGIIDDFEDGNADDWWQYLGRDTVFLTETVSPGANSTDYALKMTYQVPWIGHAGLGKTIEQDWSVYDGVRLWFLGEGLGNQLRVQLTDPAPDAGADAYHQEYFEYLITDTVTTWREVEIPFKAFRERSDWPPNHADTGNNVLDLNQIQAFALEPVKASFGEDFEDGDADGWWLYAEGGASIVSDTVSPGAEQSDFALQVTYDVFTGDAGIGASPNDDWSDLERITLNISGTNSGNDIRVELVEQGHERWMRIISDTFSGWREFSITLEASEAGFTRRYWQPPGADENGILDLASVKHIVFSPLPGWFSDDFEDSESADWWVYQGAGGTIGTTVVDGGADGTHKAFQITYDIPVGGYAGTGQTVGRDWTDYDGIAFFARGDDDALLLLEDAEGEVFERQVDLTSAWTPFSIAFSEFTYRVEGSDPGGNHELNLDEIESLMLQPSPGSGTLLLDEITVIGTSLGTGSFALDEVRLAGPGLRSGVGNVTVDEIELMGRSIYSNVMKFSNRWDRNGKDPWEGPLYTGYQDPTPYYMIGEEGVASDIVTFLADAQKAYDEIDPELAKMGPFMPVFIQDPRYSSDGKTGWTCDGSEADENTDWAQFQYRTFAHLAEYYHRSGDAEAKVVLNHFYAWLKDEDHWRVGAGGEISIPLVVTCTVTQTQEIGYRPGDFGLAAQGLIYMADKTGDASYMTDAQALLDTLLIHQDTDPLGAFLSSDERSRFGFEQAEVGIALSLYDLLLVDHGEFRCYLPIVLRQR